MRIYTNSRPLVDADDSMVAQADDLKNRAAVLVRDGYLPADYARKCFNLAEVHKMVTGAEVKRAADASNDTLYSSLTDAGFGSAGPM